MSLVSVCFNFCFYNFWNFGTNLYRSSLPVRFIRKKKRPEKRKSTKKRKRKSVFLRFFSFALIFSFGLFLLKDFFSVLFHFFVFSFSCSLSFFWFFFVVFLFLFVYPFNVFFSIFFFFSWGAKNDFYNSILFLGISVVSLAALFLLQVLLRWTNER